jgi:putative tricarboxylic transport membrane protein
MADRVILVCTIVVAAVYFYATTLIPSLEIGDPLGPKAFPRLIGVVLLIAAAMLALELRRERGKTAETGGAASFDPTVVKVLGVVVIWFGVYIALLERLGFILSTFVFLLPMMGWFNRGKWLANTLTAAAFSALTYWLFVALEVRLPRGILPF